MEIRTFQNLDRWLLAAPAQQQNSSRTALHYRLGHLRHTLQQVRPVKIVPAVQAVLHTRSLRYTVKPQWQMLPRNLYSYIAQSHNYPAKTLSTHTSTQILQKIATSDSGTAPLPPENTSKATALLVFRQWWEPIATTNNVASTMRP